MWNVFFELLNYTNTMKKLLLILCAVVMALNVAADTDVTTGDTIQLNIVDYSYIFYTESWGWWYQLVDDNNIRYEFIIFSEPYVRPNGTFTDKNMDYAWCSDNTNGQFIEDLRHNNFSISYPEEDVVHFVATFVGDSTGTVFHLDYTSPIKGFPHDATVNDGEFDEYFSIYDAKIDRSHTICGFSTCLAFSNDHNAEINLWFIDYSSDGYSITPGVYTINYTKADKTVYAYDCDGFIDAVINPSFAGYKSGSSAIGFPIWFIISGTVTVSDGLIEVDALNSNNVRIHAVIGEGTGLDHPTTPSSQAVKQIRNGQLLIQHNGKTYNAVGLEQ